MRSLSLQVRRLVLNILAFLEWWGRELREAFSPAIRHLENEKKTAILRVGENQVEAVVSDAKGLEIRRVMIVSSFDELDEAQLAQLRSVLAGAEVAVGLPDKEFCVLKLRHVGSTAPTHESVKYRLLQDSPIDVAQIAFTWRYRPVKKNSEGAEASLEVALCRQERLARIVETAGRYGISASTLGLAGPSGDKLEFVFPIRSTANWAFPVKAHLNRILLLCLMSLPMVAMVLAGSIALVEARSTKQELEAQRSLLHASEDLMRRRAESNAVHGTLENIVAMPSSVNVLNELAQLLPLDTWMTEFRLEGGSVHLIGVSANPAAAAKAIVPSRFLSDIRLGSVSSPNAATGVSQFEITATLVARP